MDSSTAESLPIKKERSQPVADESAGRKEPDVEGKPVTRHLSPLHDAAFIFTICTSQGLSLAALAQTIAPLTIIGNYFNITDPGQLSWLTAAFSLTVGTFILPAGRLGDIYGHKRLFLLGFLWLAVWSLIAGFSVYSSFTLLAVCRGFQGIGGALCTPNALALVGRTYDGDKRNMVFALFGASAPIGWTLGAVFSAIFAQLVWWPWAFWVLAIVCFAGAILVWFIVPADVVPHYCGSTGKMQSASAPTHDDRVSPPPEHDIWGALTGVSGLILFNFSWNQAGVVGWSKVYVYVLLIVSCILLAIFAWIEIRIAKQPLVPLKALHFEAILALACVAAGWASFGIWVYYEWRLIEQARGYSALAAAAQNTPVAVTGLLAAVSTGFLLSKIRVQWILFVALLLYLTGMILIATAPVDQVYWYQTFFSICIMPFGMDMSFPSGTAITSAGMAREHQGTAASLVSTVVNYSISMGLGIAGTIVRQLSDNGSSVIETFRGAWYLGVGKYPPHFVAGRMFTDRRVRRNWNTHGGVLCLQIQELTSLQTPSGVMLMWLSG